MDPEQTLKDIRRHISDIQSGQYHESDMAGVAYELAATVGALLEALSPAVWHVIDDALEDLEADIIEGGNEPWLRYGEGADIACASEQGYKDTLKRAQAIAVAGTVTPS